MDAASLFQSLTSRPEVQAPSIITGTAMGASEDGNVLVQVDGSAVAQPSEEQVTLTVATDEFAGGSYVLPSVPYPGTLTVEDDNGDALDEDDYELDGDQLTIFALSSDPVSIAYDAEVRQALTNEDFASGSVSVDSTTNLTLLEDVGGPGTADWQPCAYTLDGDELTVAGIDVMSGVVEFAYQRSVSLVGEPGDMLLPDVPDPDDVAVTGRLNGTDYVVTTWTLDGDQLTLPSGYDTFVVDYVMDEVESWNVTDQYEDEPLQDSDDAADPVTVTIGHDLQHEPDTVTSCTVDGVAATYTLSGLNVVADSPTVTDRYFTLSYELPVALEVPASEFATGPYELPYEPLGTVTTICGGVVLANSVSGLELTVSDLLAGSAYYTIAYTAQVESDVVELPCTPAVSEGQFVDIAIVNGMPSVIGASGSGDAVAAAADAAEAAATAAEAVANAVNQHFWQRATNPDGAGAGVFITEVTQEDFTDPTSPNYQSGANQLSNSQGILLRDGLTNFAQLTPGETAFYDGAGNASTNVVATFGTSGSVIGKAAESHAFIDYHSLQMVDKEGSTYFYVSDLRDANGDATIVVTHIFGGHTTIDLGTPFTSVTSVTRNGSPFTSYTPDPVLGWIQLTGGGSPYTAGEVFVITYVTPSQKAKAYTLGLRAGTSGAMSIASGDGTQATGFATFASGNGSTASGNSSHAEGINTVASGDASHAEGHGSVASGIESHAEGDSKATGNISHAEGYMTEANGVYSHAANVGTVSNGMAQTAIGKYNIADTTSALIIGGGAANNARSNVLTVDWQGNVNAEGNVNAAGNAVSKNMGGAAYASDLDDLTVPGIYYCTTASTNGPVASTAGQCVVAANPAQNIVVQLFTTYSAYPSVWVRRYYSGAWGAWQVMADRRAKTITQSVQVGTFFYRAASYIALLIPITNPNDQYTTVNATNLPASISCRDITSPSSTVTITLSDINSQTVQHGYVALRINCSGGTSTHTYVVSTSFNVTLDLS